MVVDFGKTAFDYAKHRAGFPDRFFDRLFKDGLVAEGNRVVDLGTGTGTIARGLAQRSCAVTSVDISAALLGQARELDRNAGVEVRYVEAKAEQTGLPSHAFDAVTAGQCWHWFDRNQAAQEARRLLVPKGRLIIAHFDWLPLPGNVVEATEKLIGAHNPAWHWDGGTGIHSRWFADLSQNGFADIESFSFDVSAPYSREAWLGRIRASAGIAASLPPDAVERFNAEHEEMLARNFPDAVLQIPHRVFAVFGRAAD